jgi:hypothetical protein
MGRWWGSPAGLDTLPRYGCLSSGDLGVIYAPNSALVAAAGREATSRAHAGDAPGTKLPDGAELHAETKGGIAPTPPDHAPLPSKINVWPAATFPEPPRPGPRGLPLRRYFAMLISDGKYP